MNYLFPYPSHHYPVGYPGVGPFYPGVYPYAYGPYYPSLPYYSNLYGNQMSAVDQSLVNFGSMAGSSQSSIVNQLRSRGYGRYR